MLKKLCKSIICLFMLFSLGDGYYQVFANEIKTYNSLKEAVDNYDVILYGGINLNDYAVHTKPDNEVWYLKKMSTLSGYFNFPNIPGREHENYKVTAIAETSKEKVQLNVNTHFYFDGKLKNDLNPQDTVTFTITVTKGNESTTFKSKEYKLMEKEIKYKIFTGKESIKTIEDVFSLQEVQGDLNLNQTYYRIPMVDYCLLSEFNTIYLKSELNGKAILPQDQAKEQNGLYSYFIDTVHLASGITSGWMREEPWLVAMKATQEISVSLHDKVTGPSLLEYDDRTHQYSFKNKNTQSVVLNISKATLSVGNGFQAKATVTSSNSNNNTKVTWKSSSPSIASVDQSGNVKALKAGYTYIIARTNDGVEAKCLVQVIDVAPKLNVTNATLSIGKGFRAKVTNLAGGITWKSSSPSIASVDAKGNVKTLKAGYTYIIAKTANGKEVKCLLKVVDTKPSSISMNLNNATLSIGKSFNVKASVYPTNATNKNVTWSSGNTKVVKVDQNGKVTTVGAGTTYVYAKTSNGITGKILVKVLPNPTSVTITPKSATVKVGATFKARGIVTPSNATSNLSFKSSSPSIATVDGKGNVRAIKTGYTYISVTTANGKTAKFLLRVVK